MRDDVGSRRLLLVRPTLDYFGWNRMSIELKWTLFVGLSIVVAAITAAFVFGAAALFRRIYRSFSGSN